MPIVRNGEKAKHVISGLKFTDFSNTECGMSEFIPITQCQADTSTQIEISPEDTPQTEPQVVEQSPIQIDRRDEADKKDRVIETLLEKSEALSRELVKVQAKLTNQESLFRDEMSKMKEDAFNRGVQEGISRAKMEQDTQYEEKLTQLQGSINKLEQLSSQFTSMMKNIEQELVHTSIAIAKEVVDAEITYNSGQVAINLARSLIKKIEEAKEVTIKVNHLDYESVKVGLSDMTNIKLIPDSAIARGGVIIISEVGSIEGNIVERYKKVKDDIISKI